MLFTQCGVERMRHFFGGERETLCVANWSRFLFYSEHRIETARGVIDPTGCVELFGNSAGVFRDYYFMYTIYFPFM